MCVMRQGAEAPLLHMLIAVLLSVGVIVSSYPDVHVCFRARIVHAMY
jgi:hypothetical protein